MFFTLRKDGPKACVVVVEEEESQVFKVGYLVFLLRAQEKLVGCFSSNDLSVKKDHTG